MKTIKKKVINRFHRIYLLSTVKAYHPPINKIYNWMDLVVGEKQKTELSIVLVSKAQIKKINNKYRKINKPTDILSFITLIPNFLQGKYKDLGELIISSEIVNTVAKKQNKSNHAHWAHIVIHGILHLLGHNHENKKETAIMEAQEIKLLKKLGFKDPYQ